MREVALLGSTGSIGTQALNIIRKNRDRLTVVLLSCGSRLDIMSEQLDEFGPKYAALPDTEDARKLASEHGSTSFFYGESGLAEASEKCEYNFMLNSLLGISGLIPTYNCLMSGRNIALANKETLVAGGEVIIELANKKGLKVIPVDSEHSAVFQCLQGTENRIKKVTLTASGGPFRGKTREELKEVKPEDALKHPNWKMGEKITIDSATLMNKGFEVIEAKWLFGLGPDQVDVIIHPESIIHSMVEFTDNSTLAQLGQPDMSIPISYAFSYPDRWPSSAKPIDLISTSSLNFSKPDINTFKCLKLAIEALRKGSSYPIVLNAANEVLVRLFLDNKIKFLDIGDTIERILDSHKPSGKCRTPEEIIEVDQKVRKDILSYM